MNFNGKEFLKWLASYSTHSKKKSPKPTRPQPVQMKQEQRSPKIDIDPPLPKTEKAAEPKTNHGKEFVRLFRTLTYSRSSWEVWNDFVVMTACSISNAVDKKQFESREKRYMQIVQKYSKEDQNIFPQLFAEVVLALEDDPEQDFLGAILTELKLRDQSKGQYFTPYDACRVMSGISLLGIENQIKKEGYATIHDPCCGSGVILISEINEARRILEKEKLNYQNHVLITAQDIDETAALMCYIQISLLGMAGFVKVGDSLADPITDHDSWDAYWFTPMYFSDIWTFRRLFHNLSAGEHTDGTH